LCRWFDPTSGHHSNPLESIRYNCNKDVIGLIGDDLNFVNLSDAGKENAHGKIDEDKLVSIFSNFN